MSENSFDKQSEEELIARFQELNLDKELIEAARTRTLTKEIIDNSELSQLLRLATKSFYVKEQLRNIMGFSGCNLKPEITLFPHQVKALIFMKEREENNIQGISGGILCLKMGMGKTLTGTVFSYITKRRKPVKGEPWRTTPTLVICSKTVLMEWENIIPKFFTKGKILIYHRDRIRKSFENMSHLEMLSYDMVVTTYDVCKTICKKLELHNLICEYGEGFFEGKVICIKGRTLSGTKPEGIFGPELIYRIPWKRIICDESQCFANPKTYLYRAIMAIYGKYKWCFTGTPIRNYDTDIWAQIRFLGYNKITTPKEWTKAKGAVVFRKELSEVMLNMDYESANIILPPKIEETTIIALEKEEKDAYDYVLGETRKMYDEMMSKLTNFACVLAMFLRLRQTCIAPYLISIRKRKSSKTSKSIDENEVKDKKEFIEKVENSTLGTWLKNKEGTSGIFSAKISAIIKILKKLEPDRKILIFSMFSSCLDLLADSIDKRIENYKYIQIDGSVTGNDRQEAIAKFKTNPDYRALLLTYKIGAEGLNLTEATCCICIEPWWTDAVHNQAKARCWRTGQTKPVTIFNIIVKDTIEEKVLEICRQKNDLTSNYMEGTDFKIKPGLDKFTLGRILGKC